MNGRLVRLPRGARRVWCACGEEGLTIWPGPLCGAGEGGVGSIAYDCECGLPHRIEFVRPLPAMRDGVRWRRPLVYYRPEMAEETEARRAECAAREARRNQWREIRDDPGGYTFDWSPNDEGLLCELFGAAYIDLGTFVNGERVR